MCSYDVRLKQLPPRSVIDQCFTYISPQAGDVSLLETVLQEFAAFEHLPVTVTEADLLRDIPIHLPVNESDFLRREEQIRGARQHRPDRSFELERRGVLIDGKDAPG